jgi:hypothetical protein
VAGTRRVVYARVNRRRPDQEDLAERAFAEDMRTLVQAEAIHAPYGTDEWFATDLSIEPSGTFMSGIVGFMSSEEYRLVDWEKPSWKKAPTTVVEGGTRNTIVPFAVDLRRDRRWIAFAPTARIQPVTFTLGFKVLLESAVTSLGLMPAEWDVDLIPSTKRIFEWLSENPDVSEFIRVVRRPNPDRQVHQDIARMRSMGARTKREEYTPFYGKTLNLADNPELVEELIARAPEGDVDITIRTRTGRSTFRSRREIEEGTVSDWGRDLDAATDAMLEAVRLWSEGRPLQGRLTAEGEGDA